MNAPLPKLPAGREEQLVEFTGQCNSVLDAYINGFELDLNRHAVKHGTMPQHRAVNDLGRILARDVPANMLPSLLALAILRLIGKKAKGQAR